MTDTISVTYKATSNALTANTYLREISSAAIFAADFEAASRYTPSQITEFQTLISDPSTDKFTRIGLQSRVNASGLSHPAHVRLTHCSIATSESEAFVFILDNKQITNRVLNFLVTTEQRQVWHNATFDFRLLYHFTGRMPILYEDSQLFAKCILNHVDTTKAEVGLKQLAGHRYGQWAISPDNFDAARMYEPDVLHYAAIDACATYWLYHSINRHVHDQNIL